MKPGEDEGGAAGAVRVADYLNALPEAMRTTLEAVRATIRAVAPEATETIAYDMPAFRLKGRFLVSYAAFSRHWSLFPASGDVRDALGEEIAPYLSGKATLRFPSGRPVPPGLVERIVRIRVAEVGAGSAD